MNRNYFLLILIVGIGLTVLIRSDVQSATLIELKCNNDILTFEEKSFFHIALGRRKRIELYFSDGSKKRLINRHGKPGFLVYFNDDWEEAYIKFPIDKRDMLSVGGNSNLSTKR